MRHRRRGGLHLQLGHRQVGRLHDGDPGGRRHRNGHLPPHGRRLPHPRHAHRTGHRRRARRRPRGPEGRRQEAVRPQAGRRARPDVRAHRLRERRGGRRHGGRREERHLALRRHTLHRAGPRPEGRRQAAARRGGRRGRRRRRGHRHRQGTGTLRVRGRRPGGRDLPPRPPGGQLGLLRVPLGIRARRTQATARHMRAFFTVLSSDGFRRRMLLHVRANHGKAGLRMSVCPGRAPLGGVPPGGWSPGRSLREGNAPGCTVTPFGGRARRHPRALAAPVAEGATG